LTENEQVITITTAVRLYQKHTRDLASDGTQQKTDTEQESLDVSWQVLPSWLDQR